MKVNQFIRGEEGFWSAVLLILTVTLGSLAMATHFMMNKETENTSNNSLVMQLDYSANAGALYGIKALREGVMAIGDENSMTVEGMDVSVGISKVYSEAESDSVIRLDVLASMSTGLSRALEIDFPEPRRLEDNAITTTGEIEDNIHVFDENWVEDPSLMVEGASSIPDVDTDSLRGDASMVITSIHLTGNAWAAPDKTGEAEFVASGGQLPIIYIENGDLQINGNIILYGIYVIMDGNVYLNGTPNITNGVIYVHNEEKMIIRGNDQEGQASMVGGIVSHGDIDGNGKNINIQYCREYLEQFVKYVDQVGSYDKFIAWRYK